MSPSTGMNAHGIRFLTFAAVLGLLASSAPAVAAAPDVDDASTKESPATVDTRGLTGDWGGLRSSLEQRGLTAFASYTTGFWANLVGGRETGVRYLGFAQWGLDADLEALAGWRGAAFHADWQSYHGGQPSEYLVGASPLQNASGLEAEQSIRFYQLYLEQAALNDRLYAKVGQLALDQDFMVADHALRLRNAAFGDFVTSGSNETVAVYPVAAPGLYLEAEPFLDWRIRVGAYTSDPGDDERDNYGFDWSFSSRAGATIFGEIETEQDPFGLRGSYAIGVGVETGNLDDFGDGGRSEGLQVFYASIDQTLYSSKPSGGESGLEVGAFLRAAVPVQTDRITFAWQMNGGIELIGAVPGRPTDAIAMGFAYLDFGHDYLRSVRADGLRVTSRELALELTYRAELTSWLWVQPDLQYFVDPFLGRRDAFVFGLLVGIDL